MLMLEDNLWSPVVCSSQRKWLQIDNPIQNREATFQIRESRYGVEIVPFALKPLPNGRSAGYGDGPILREADVLQVLNQGLGCKRTHISGRHTEHDDPLGLQHAREGS